MTDIVSLTPLAWVRSPRPGHLDDYWRGGMSTIELADALDSTPVLDLKPLMVETLPADAVVQPPWAGDLMSRYYLPNDQDPC